MTEKQQLVLTLIDVEKISHSEAARRLNCSRGNIGRLYQSARHWKSRQESPYKNLCSRAIHCIFDYFTVDNKLKEAELAEHQKNLVVKFFQNHTYDDTEGMRGVGPKILKEVHQWATEFNF